MLSYFALYAGPLANRPAAVTGAQASERSFYGILPHEIAALNNR